jgi:hypothetical protein
MEFAAMKDEITNLLTFCGPVEVYVYSALEGLLIISTANIGHNLMFFIKWHMISEKICLKYIDRFTKVCGQYLNMP